MDLSEITRPKSSSTLMETLSAGAGRLGRATGAMVGDASKVIGDGLGQARNFIGRNLEAAGEQRVDAFDPKIMALLGGGLGGLAGAGAGAIFGGKGNRMRSALLGLLAGGGIGATGGALAGQLNNYTARDLRPTSMNGFGQDKIRDLSIMDKLRGFANRFGAGVDGRVPEAIGNFQQNRMNATDGARLRLADVPGFTRRALSNADTAPSAIRGADRAQLIRTMEANNPGWKNRLDNDFQGANRHLFLNEKSGSHGKLAARRFIGLVKMASSLPRVEAQALPLALAGLLAGGGAGAAGGAWAAGKGRRRQGALKGALVGGLTGGAGGFAGGAIAEGAQRAGQQEGLMALVRALENAK